jgi:hypothetical protein
MKNEISNRMLFMRLEELGVTKIEIPFDGSGDSGSIEEHDIKILDAKGNEVTIHSDDDTNYESVLSDFGYGYLEAFYAYDWYNNDGGYGTINIDIKAKTINVIGYQRISDVEEANTTSDLFQVLDKI